MKTPLYHSEYARQQAENERKAIAVLLFAAGLLLGVLLMALRAAATRRRQPGTESPIIVS